mmetsp:Transcript_921/g.1979  ORF Transcript_921/g.1979 Transcript_921/m.1979 type:complete len:542 (+) Transcript_921:150-1775(+)
MTPQTTYYSWFPGEEYLTITLPNYDWERRLIICKIIGSLILFLLVLPMWFSTKVVTNSTTSTDAKKATERNNVNSSETLPGKRRGKKSNTDKYRKSAPSKPTSQQSEINGVVAYEISSIASNFFSLCFVLSVFAIPFFSENNLFPARTLLRAPVFTREECQHIIDMAHDAALRNSQEAEEERTLLLTEHPELLSVEVDSQGNIPLNYTTTTSENLQLYQKFNKVNSLLRSPKGWKKDRHTHYPTTDLNLVTDPFTAEDKEWLGQRLDARLAPLVERAYGIARGAIRANDIFVVRYDANEGQPNLRKHTDSAHLSFNVLLNDEFEGGGTRFHNRIDESYIDIFPEVGEILLSHAHILHEGMATTKGTRYILVGFDQIDEKDPLTGESTGLSLFASWLNFCWAQIRFREGWEDGLKRRRKRNRNDGGSLGGDDIESDWRENRYVTSLFSDLDSYMTKFLDRFAPFRSARLVKSEFHDEYIAVMDRAMEQRKQMEEAMGVSRSRATGYSSWFKGQQIHLDVFGSYVKSWRERTIAEDKFKDETL